MKMSVLQRSGLCGGYLHSTILFFLLMAIISCTSFNITTLPTKPTGHPTTDKQDTDSSQLRMILGIISAVVVVVIVPVAIIITICVVKRWKKGKHRNKRHDEDDTDTKLTSSAYTSALR